MGFLPRLALVVADPAGLPLGFAVDVFSLMSINPSSSSVSSSVSPSAGLLRADRFVRVFRFLLSVAEIGAFAFVVLAVGLAAPAFVDLLVVVVIRFAVRVVRCGDAAGITAARAIVLF
jgi:hypothetical protein